MKLHGLQKMTLLDFPGRVACTVFLGGCDFRCPFCHNYELVDGTEPPVMEDTEFFDFLESRKGLLDGVAVTGGEPCLHRDLPAFLERVRAMGFATKLDTAGYHPDLLKELLDRGLLDYIAMDIKNAPEKYAVTCGVETVDLEKVRASIIIIMECGVPYEFRRTVVKELHEPEDFLSIGALI
ncbi:MAG: anaerobic ribonucleoside-triphosphate reductase activating protein, partial [Clostridia bacterium]|nr:anaerobic ribonucleoside-triphosphate reductase activating protein [Clostridia bacterium]